MPAETVSLEFLSRQSKLTMEELRLLRKDVSDMMRLLNATYELTRRVERREGELRDDLELMVKMEIGGSLANMQTSIDSALSRIEGAVGEIADRVSALEYRP